MLTFKYKTQYFKENKLEQLSRHQCCLNHFQTFGRSQDTQGRKIAGAQTNRFGQGQVRPYQLDKR